jgi:hypothetical protein
MKIIISELEKKRILNMHLKLNVNSQSYNINEDYGIESGGGSNNGKLPSSQLTKIQNDVQGNEEHLSIGAAIQFNKMVVDAKKQGVNITLNDAYRVCGQPDDYVKYKKGQIKVSQWATWEKHKFHGGNAAAKPIPDTKKTWHERGGGYCTSNHGFGNAIDVADGKSWIRKNGEKYGWYWGEATSENWHFTFCGDGVVNTPNFCKKIVNKTIVNKDEPKFGYPIVNDKDLEDEVFDPPIDMYPILKNLGRIRR